MKGKYEGFADQCEEFLKYINKTNNFKKECADKLSSVDRNLSILDHALLFRKLDAVKMIKLQVLRRKLLSERQIIKDDILYTEEIIKQVPNIQVIHNNLNDLKTNLINFENKLNEREYMQFDLDKLFDENKSINLPDIKKKDKKTTITSNIQKLKQVDKSGIIKTNNKDLRLEQLFDQIAQ